MNTNRMAHRQFQDESGRRWEAWDVHPSTVEVRLKLERAHVAARAQSNRHATFPLPPELRSGWLAFQCADESRRLAPIPAEWDRMTEPELVRLAAAANRIARRVMDGR
jgi:hypothetical protein